MGSTYWDRIRALGRAAGRRGFSKAQRDNIDATRRPSGTLSDMLRLIASRLGRDAYSTAIATIMALKRSEENKRVLQEIIETRRREGDYLAAPLIYVSDIMQQFYCEKRLDMYQKLLEYQYVPAIGDIISMDVSSREESIHETKIGDLLFRLERVGFVHPFSIEEYLRYALEGKPYVVRLAAGLCVELEGGDIFLFGRPAVMIFDRCRLSVLAHYKFRFSDDRRIFMKDITQLGIYKYMLCSLGLDMEACEEVMVVSRASCLHCPTYVEKLSNIDTYRVDESEVFVGEPSPDNKGEGSEICSCEKGFIVRYAYCLPVQFGKKSIEWAMEYWLGRRDPIPTQYRKKCDKCPYVGLCDGVPGLTDEQREEARRRLRGIIERWEKNRKYLERLMELTDEQLAKIRTLISILRASDRVRISDLAELLGVRRRVVLIGIGIAIDRGINVRVSEEIIELPRSPKHRQDIGYILGLTACGVEPELIDDTMLRLAKQHLETHGATEEY